MSSSRPTTTTTTTTTANSTAKKTYNFVLPQHSKSPPKFSAEVAAKFDANIRDFKNPSNRRSPTNFLKRGGGGVKVEATVATTKNYNGNKSSSGDIAGKPPRNSPLTIRQRNEEGDHLEFGVNTSNNNEIMNAKSMSQNNSSGRNNFSSNPFATNIKISPQKRNSSTGSRTKSSERKSRKIFDGKSSLSNNPFAQFERKKAATFSVADEDDEFCLALKNLDWNGCGIDSVQIQRQLVDHQHVEHILRLRMQDLELDQLKIMWKFKNEFEV